MSQVLLHWLPRCRFTVSYSFSKSEPRYHTSDTWSYSFSLRPEITLIITDWHYYTWHLFQHSFHFRLRFQNQHLKPQAFFAPLTFRLALRIPHDNTAGQSPGTTHIHFYTLHLAFAPDTIDLKYRTWRTSKLICVSLVYTQNPARQVVLSVCCRHATDPKNHSRLRSHARGWAVEGIIYAIATCKITVVESWSSHSVIDPICGA